MRRGETSLRNEREKAMMKNKADQLETYLGKRWEPQLLQNCNVKNCQNRCKKGLSK